MVEAIYESGDGCPVCHEPTHYSRDFLRRTCEYCGFIEGDAWSTRPRFIQLDHFLFLLQQWKGQYKARKISYHEFNWLISYEFRIDSPYSRKFENGIFYPSDL